MIKLSGPAHIDQGIAVTSHASQGKSVDQVIVSVPVAAFSQVNEAQFYVSMSRARCAMHLYTDSKAALKEAVIRPSERLSPWELLSVDDNPACKRSDNITRGRAFLAELRRAGVPHKQPASHRDNKLISSGRHAETKGIGLER